MLSKTKDYTSLSAILQRLQAQDRSIYTNIKLQGKTPRFEDSIKLHEGSDDPNPTKATQGASTLQDLDCELRTL
jgi:hypothetical protein